MVLPMQVHVKVVGRIAAPTLLQDIVDAVINTHADLYANKFDILLL